MHTAHRILLLALALTGWAVADLPKKVPITKYTELWTNSPFTSKPPPPEAGPLDKTFEDLALLGVSPISGGYRVTLLNKKKPDERITVDSSSPKSGFKILDVKRKSGDPLGTVVRMSSGTLTGTVAFDEKLLTLAAPQPTRANPQVQPGMRPPGQPQLQPGQQTQPGQPGQPGQIPQRQPRPRVVPPPTPQTPPQAQGQPATANPRPDRRGLR